MSSMTPEQAQSFDSFSLQNAAILYQAAADHGCECGPYRDWYTYNRWIAQGFQVQKGQHGVKLMTFAPITKKDDTTGETKVVGKRPWSSTVFCRCQVKERE